MAYRSSWPFGVTARFPNLSGAMVDVEGEIVASWHCNGCPASSPRGARLGKDEAARQAEAHASQCTGMPGR